MGLLHEKNCSGPIFCCPIATAGVNNRANEHIVEDVRRRIGESIFVIKPCKEESLAAAFLLS